MRDYAPGEYLPNADLHNQKQFHNRTYIARVVQTNPSLGTMLVRLSSGEGFRVPLPVLGLSADTANASWIRYAPQEGDYVKVAFGPDSRPEQVSYASWGDLPSSPAQPGQLGGYRRALDAQDDLTEFLPLQPGEWDMRSSGNAYIKGSEQGTLTLSGGQVLWQLSDKQEQALCRANLVNFDEGGTQLKLGDVRDPDGNVQSGSGAAAASPAKSYDLQVGTLDPTGILTIPLARTAYGRVSDSSGNAETGGGDGQELRILENVTDLTGVATSFRRETSVLGSTLTTLGPLASNYTVTGGIPAAATFNVAMGNIALDADVNAQLTASTGIVSLGAFPATDSVIKGTTYSSTFFVPFIAQQQLLATANASFLTALAPVLTALPFGVGIAAGAQAVALAALNTSYSAQLSLYAQTPTQWLSLKTFTV